MKQRKHERNEESKTLETGESKYFVAAGGGVFPHVLAKRKRLKVKESHQPGSRS